MLVLKGIFGGSFKNNLKKEKLLRPKIASKYS